MKATSDRGTSSQRHARKGVPPVRTRSGPASAAAHGANVAANANANAGAAAQVSGGAISSSAAQPAGRDAAARPLTPRQAFLRGFVYAWRGLVYAVRTQRNVRVHMLVGTAAVGLGIALRISAVEFAVLFVAITLVFVAEMFNTVAEACVDLITAEYHPLARVAKDVAAGAVLVNAMLSVVIGLFIFVPHLWPLVLRWLGW